MKKIILFALGFVTQILTAQAPERLNSTEIYDALEKLNFLGSVLYIAAHPDDENTKLISYYANKVHARTGYLSLTRGDGGQNLIGPEIRELLGIIRTEELMAARRIDGGEQFFSRANDFGFSKTPQETLKIWNKDSVMADVVRTLRKFRPDVVINRFDHRTEGNTHGHHTSSARLSVEAFDFSGDATKFPEQLNHYKTWQPKRLFFNASWWFYGSKEKFEKANKDKLHKVDVGVYYPTKGFSNTEIASHSRSQHKSQGFGTMATRGSETEYLEPIKGDFSQNSPSIFEGIDTSWQRVKGGKPIGKLIAEIQEAYNFKNPAASIPKLIEVYKRIRKLEDDHWRKIKTKEIKNIIVACAGMYLEATATEEFVVPGDSLTLKLEVTHQNNYNSVLQKIKLNELDYEKTLAFELKNNQSYYTKISTEIPENFEYTSPYWLTKKSSLGMYHVEDSQKIGLPETPPALTATFSMEIEGEKISFTQAVTYKMSDPVEGEVYKPLAIVPDISVSIKNKNLIFNSNASKTVSVKLKSYRDRVSGEARLQLPDAWEVSPRSISVSLQQKGDSKTVNFQVKPPQVESEVTIGATFSTQRKVFSKELNLIDYRHIPQQAVLLPAQTKAIRLNIKKKGDKLAYIKGAGDEVPKSLEQIGYQVDYLQPEEISLKKIEKYDGVIIGIRAYNTSESLIHKQKTLFEYVENGGLMLAQYNTSRGLKTENIAPYPLHLSRNRVTDENAKVTFINPGHPVLNTPNKITEKDFEGWVQERGLYFPDEWDKAFTPLLKMHDKGEKPTKGSLLIAPYGKGYYIYTGLSFFRELPAGVSGAYRLFTNLLSLRNYE